MKTLQAMNRKALMVSMLALVGMLADHAQAQSQEFELGPDDQWKNTSSEEMTLRKNQLLSARRAILEGNPQRGKDLAGAFVDRYPNSPLRAEAYLIRGDALLAMSTKHSSNTRKSLATIRTAPLSSPRSNENSRSRNSMRTVATASC
jgi:hypothetical protein